MKVFPGTFPVYTHSAFSQSVFCDYSKGNEGNEGNRGNEEAKRKTIFCSRKYSKGNTTKRKNNTSP